ncbi:hypothetical protein BCR44DRAFT_197003 [Catenaria anguillulae PL171]|uniref:Uncharacterized protein n=1 Tax=Catenaria anguillulae PL171 TaxID=765915 RepID=A0A1Y2HMJ1_9FUNG|nr:hypothetical protein BCR44DRAFT_197003 [Catenaria anguillulae PL171]
MLLFSVIGVITSINDISTVSSAIDSVFPFRTSFADNSPFSAAASSVRAELERLRIYLFINLAANLLQALVSGAGLLAILKNLPATHKLYLYGSGALVVLRVVLLFLLRVNGLSIFTMLLNAAILYAIWVYQGKIEASVADAPKEPTPNESTEMTA